MNRLARPTNFANRIRTPLLRQHYVYRAFNSAGELLYVGCTYDLTKRLAAHRTMADWRNEDGIRIKVEGPYNYETARHIELTAINTEWPTYNYTPQRREIDAAYARLYDAAHHQGANHWDATAYAQSRLPYPGNRGPLRNAAELLETARRVA